MVKDGPVSFRFQYRLQIGIVVFFKGYYEAYPGKDPIIDILSKVVTTHIGNAEVCWIGYYVLFSIINYNGKQSPLFTR